MAPVRTRLAAVAAVAALVLAGATGCSRTPETIRTYTPANGTNATLDQVKVRGLTLVTDGQRAALTGTIVGTGADTLTKVGVDALDAAGTQTASLNVDSAKVAIPAGGAVTFQQHPVTIAGALVPGLDASVELTFERSGVARLRVPVVSNENPDFSSVLPQR